MHILAYIRRGSEVAKRREIESRVKERKEKAYRKGIQKLTTNPMPIDPYGGSASDKGDLIHSMSLPSGILGGYHHSFHCASERSSRF